MSKIHHVNCGTLRVPGYPTVVCHCLLLEDKSGLALIDTGNDQWRRESLAQLRRLYRDHSDEIVMIGYHDVTEFSGDFDLQLQPSTLGH